MIQELPALQLHALDLRQLERALSWCTPERALSELRRLEARHAQPKVVLRTGREVEAWVRLRRRRRGLPS